MNEDRWDKEDRWYKRISFWILIVVLGLVPLVLNGIMPIVPSVGDDNGWLGFWGGYLGAAITVLGVYIQIDLTNKSTRKLEAVKSRPYFCLNIEEADIFEQNYFKNREDRQQLIDLYNHQIDEVSGITTTDVNGKVVPFKIKLPEDTKKFLRIQNISIHHSFSLDIILNFSAADAGTEAPKPDVFRILDINPYEEKHLYIGEDSITSQLSSVDLIFLTEFREKIKITFEYNKEKKEFEHLKGKNVLEESSAKSKIDEAFNGYNPSKATETVGLNVPETKEKFLIINK